MWRWHLLALLNILGVLVAASANGQSIVGTVVDELDGSPIPGADIYVMSDTLVARTQSAEDGTFQVELNSAGAYVLSVRRLGYVSTDPAPLEVGQAEEVTVTLRLARAAIPLDPLTVEVRRTSLRHAGSWEGFLARRELFPPIGNRRAVKRDDPEMEGAITMRDVLRWLRPSGRNPGCMVTLVDGFRTQENIYEMPLSLIEGVEYYARVTDAPLDYAAQSGGCGVIVVWRHGRN